MARTKQDVIDNPKFGDVLRDEGGFVSRIVAVDAMFVTEETSQIGSRRSKATVYSSKSEWRKWAEDAEVLDAAD